MKCGACGGDCRKTKRAQVLLVTGELAARRVCLTCAKTGARIVASTIRNKLGRLRCSHDGCTYWALYCDEHRVRPLDSGGIVRALERRRAHHKLTICEPELGADPRASDAHTYASGVLEGLDIAIGIVHDAIGGRPT